MRERERDRARQRERKRERHIILEVLYTYFTFVKYVFFLKSRS